MSSTDQCEQATVLSQCTKATQQVPSSSTPGEEKKNRKAERKKKHLRWVKSLFAKDCIELRSNTFEQGGSSGK